MKTEELLTQLRYRVVEDLLVMKPEDVDPVGPDEFSKAMDELIEAARTSKTLTELYEVIAAGGWTLGDLPYLICSAVCDDWHDVREEDAFVPPDSQWST